MENLPPNSSITNMDDREAIVSDATTRTVMTIFLLGVTPAISILGVIGNFFSIIILLKHGLSKCSNILLFVLAVTDITFLVTFNNAAKIMYFLAEDRFVYNVTVSTVLFVIYCILTVLDYAASPMSLTLPMLITIERLVVIFYPFRYSQILTPFRTWVACFVAALYWLGLAIYLSFWIELEYTDVTNGTSYGVIGRSQLYEKDQQVVKAIDEVYIYTCMRIPAVFTVIGCIIIAIMVKRASIKRKKMTSNSFNASTHRTTRMLLAVCALFCVTTAVFSLPSYIPQYASYSLTDDSPKNIHTIMYQVMNTVVCLNSSCNFIIYISLNKNFRNTYKQFSVNCKASC